MYSRCPCVRLKRCVRRVRLQCAAAACRTPASQIASPLPFPTADAGVPPTAVTPNTQPRAGGVRGRGGAAEEATPSTSFNRADKRWERERERERAREEVSSDDRHGHRRAQKRRKLGERLYFWVCGTVGDVARVYWEGRNWRRHTHCRHGVKYRDFLKIVMLFFNTYKYYESEMYLNTNTVLNLISEHSDY